MARLLLRGAAWFAYTVSLMAIVGIAVRAWNCWGDTCPPPSAVPVVELLAVLAIISMLAMLWAGSLARRWLELRPGRRWLATGSFYTLLTLPLVTTATLVTVEVVAMLRDAEKASRASRVWEMNGRVSEIESEVRALILEAGAAQHRGPVYRLPEWDAGSARACASPEISGGEKRGLIGEEGRRLER